MDQVQQELGHLVSQWLRISAPLQHLHQIREKMALRGHQSFDPADILDQLGQLQHILAEFNREMLAIHDLLKA